MEPIIATTSFYFPVQVPFCFCTVQLIAFTWRARLSPSLCNPISLRVVENLGALGTAFLNPRLVNIYLARSPFRRIKFKSLAVFENSQGKDSPISARASFSYSYLLFSVAESTRLRILLHFCSIQHCLTSGGGINLKYAVVSIDKWRSLKGDFVAFE